MQTWLNQFEQAYINFKQVMQTPDEKLAQFKINRKALDRQHLFILQKLGKTEQVTEILLKQQEIIATQSRKIAELIKEAHAEHEKELELKRRKAQEREARQEQLAQTKASNAQSAQFEEEIPLSFEGKDDNEPNVEPVKKEKKKTRGKTKPTAPKSALEKPKPKSLIHIDMLTENKNAHKTFEKLFGKYELGINSDSNVKISVNEIGCFFEALGQDYDPSGGHGSHKKATLNFQEFGSEADEKVIILTNKTYLKPEQIKNIRLAFVNARIVPNDPDIIGRLRQEGLL